MSSNNTSGSDELLLRDLVGGLSIPGRASTLSVGIVGNAGRAPLCPSHCLRCCLDGDSSASASRGCAFLQAAARGTIDKTALSDGRCPKDFQVAAQQIAVGNESLVLMTVEGNAVPGAPGPDEAVLLGHLDSVARLVRRIGQMLEENTGFADEVLRNYEQLNLIFDLTQQISHVAEARAIEALLLQRVASLLAAQWVCAVTSEGEWRTYAASDNPAGGSAATFDRQEAAKAIEFVRQSRQVQVSVIGGRQIIAGPLVRLDDKVDVVLTIREDGRAAFTSGDMMIVESLLTFGGQIISNSELHERLRKMSIEVTRALVAAIDKKDHYTSGHSERGGFLTRLTAQELDVSPAEQQYMEWAGLLHDVGKIGIPEEILCKPGRLTKEEFDVVKQHPRMGYEILKPIASLGVILDGVLYHHEYPDGSGYPEGLVGDQIPLVARIIHVVDTFDALTSNRSYRKAFTIDKAFEIIREEQGVRTDKDVSEAFFRAFERYRREHPVDFEIKFRTALEAEHAVC